MLRHSHIDRICSIVLVLTLLATGGYMAACASGLIAGSGVIGYETRLFDPSRVHTIDIVMDGWEDFIATATSEEYSACTIVIDGEKYANAAIRGKGNTSLSNVASYGNDRYSFKVEFDHFQPGMSYHGLDKLSLNNLIQDPTCMKDYLAYTLMGKMGVAAPLCSFVQVSVNGEPWGFYLAVEGVEDSFLMRNYGADHGELYKPDSMSFGGGRGNGRNFNMDDFAGQTAADDAAAIPSAPGNAGRGGMGFPGMSGVVNERGEGQRGMGSMGSADVMLQYIDDDPASYQNIFSNAKTDVNADDQIRLIASLKKLSDPETAASAVDQDAVIRYFAVHNFLCNDDSYTGSMIHNYYLYEENGVLAMIPWDYNLAFGGFGGGEDATSLVNRPIDELVTSGDASTRPMTAWITADDAAIARYHAIYALMMDEVFASGWFTEEFDRVAAMIAPYVLADEHGFYANEEHLAAVDALRSFCLLRADSVTGQLNGTIPATTAGQVAKPDALIDASHVDLSDMGGMGGGMNRGGEQNGRGGERTFGGGQAMPGMQQPRGQAGAGSVPPGGQPGEGSMQPGQGSMTDVRPPDMADITPPDGAALPQPTDNAAAAPAPFPEQQSPLSDAYDAPAMLAVSAAVLATGLLIVQKMRSGR